MVPPPSPAAAATAAERSLLVLLLAVAAAATTVLAEDRPIPDFLMVCKRNDANLDQCLEKSISGLRPRLATGIPEMNVPSMEPLELKEFVLTDNGNFRITGNDIKCFGTSQFIMTEFKFDVDKGLYTFHLDFPEGMKVEGRYSVKGRVLLLPVTGEGPVYLNLTSPSADVVLHSTFVKRNDVEYLDFPNLEVKIVTPGGSIRLENLFGGDKVLGDVVNSAVNANFDHILHDLKPSIEKALEKNLLEIAQGVVSCFPAKDLFPES